MTNTNKKTSIIWTITIENLQKLLDESNSISSILSKLGLSKTSAGSYKALNNRIKSDKLDLTIFYQNKKNNPCHKSLVTFSKLKKIPIEQILIKNSSYSRFHLKKRLVEENLKEYKCIKCGNTGEWSGEKLSLQLEHINGINNDNRLENLCFLCPNCHSQSSTFCGRNIIKKEKYCKNCAKIVDNGQTLCMECRNKNKKENLKLKITKEELEVLILTKTYIEIGRIFGVGGNAIKKRCLKYNINVSHIKQGNYAKEKSILNKLTKDQLEEELNKNSLNYISKKYKCSTETIKQMIKKYNIDYKVYVNMPITDVEKEKIIDMYKIGMYIINIAKVLNRDRHIIKKIIDKHFNMSK